MAVGWKHHDGARLHRRCHRSARTREGLRFSWRRLRSRFHRGPGLAGLFATISYTAPIWAAPFVTVIATAMASFWLPETVHRGDSGTLSPWRALPEVFGRPLLMADFLYWFLFSVCNTTFALFAFRRFGFDVVHTGYVLAAFGFLGVIVQGGMVGPIVRVLGVLRTFLMGL